MHREFESRTFGRLASFSRNIYICLFLWKSFDAKLWCHPLLGMNGPWEFQNLYWAIGYCPQPNSNNPPQSLIGTSHHITSNSSTTLFIYRCEVETIKLNFHLELHATLDCNLNSGLFLELQVWCVLVSHKA
jgi:hypothetical protein